MVFEILACIAIFGANVFQVDLLYIHQDFQCFCFSSNAAVSILELISLGFRFTNELVEFSIACPKCQIIVNYDPCVIN